MSTAVAKTVVLKSINPYNGEVLKTFDEMSTEEVDSAIARADEAFRHWRETSFEDRAGILRRGRSFWSAANETGHSSNPPS